MFFDGLHAASISRLMRGRFGVRNGMPNQFLCEHDRLAHWASEWVLSSDCKSHNCSNAVVWSLKQHSTPELQTEVHIAIKSLRNSADDVRTKLSAFVRVRVRGLDKRTIDQAEVQECWEFCLIRSDLMKFFIDADPVWNGEFLEVDEVFLKATLCTRVGDDAIVSVFMDGLVRNPLVCCQIRF